MLYRHSPIFLLLSGCLWVSQAEFEDAADRDDDGFVAVEDGGEDCNDANPDVHPDAEEVCNDDIDNDCSGEADNNGIGEKAFRPDGDSDGYGDASADPVIACEGSALVEGLVDGEPDCDDTNPAINPGQTDICNDIDDDCDQEVDEDATFADWWPDEDRDGFGDEQADPVFTCDPAVDYADNNEDCDDSAVNINPTVTDVCDGVDNDCDGATDEDTSFKDWYLDDDGDGAGDPNTSVYTCEALKPSDYVDNSLDCFDDDPTTIQLTFWLDDDTDGYGDPNTSTEACAAPSKHVDNNLDCNDTTDEISPAESEICEDGIDNNCDGTAAGCGLAGERSTADADLTGGGIEDATVIGDINGDSRDDLFITAVNPDYGYIVHGSAAMDLETPDITTEWFPTAVDSIGDLTGNPRPELGLAAGELLMFFDVDASAPDLVAGDAFFTAATGAQDGPSILDFAVGDLDCNSSTIEVAVGIPDHDDTFPIGRVVVFPYTPNATVDMDDALLVIDGSFEDQRFGFDVEIADLTGDGCAELVVAGPSTTGVTNNEAGGVYVFDGSLTGSASTADALQELRDFVPGDQLGFCLLVDDIDEDGAADLLVGSGGNPDFYLAGIYAGPLTGTEAVEDADPLFIDGATNPMLGALSFVPGDFNGDGVADLALGHGGSVEVPGGGFHTFFGPPPSGQVDRQVQSDGALGSSSASDVLGFRGTSGDLDGDGYDDLVTTAFASRTAYVYFGSAL